MKNVILAAIALLTILSLVLTQRSDAQFRASEAFMNNAIAKNLQENSPAKMLRKQYWDCTAKFGKVAGFFSSEGTGISFSYWFDPLLHKRSMECSLTEDQWEKLNFAVGDFFFYF